MDADTLKYLGRWGWHHTMLHAIAFIAAGLTSLQGLVYSFTCMLDSEDKNDTYSTAFGHNQSQWARLYTYETQGGYDVYCKYCPDMIINETILPGQCGDNFTAIDCNSFIYDTSRFTSTIAMTYDLVCTTGAWKQELAKSLFMVGILLGAGFWGTLADRIGRRPTYIIGSVMVLLCSNLYPLMPNYQMICLGQVLLGFLNVGPHLGIFTILMEYCGSDMRSASGMITNMYFSIGYLLTGLLAYLVRDWKLLMWSCSIPSVLYIVTIVYIPESYTWLITKGRVTEARREIVRLCRLDKIEVPKDLDDQLQKAAVSVQKQQKSNATIIDLFKNWKMARNTLILFFTWFAVNMAYYGISLNAGDLPGDMYVNFELMGAVEIPAGLLTIPFMNWIGRVPCLYGLMCIGGVALFISGFLANVLPSYAITTCALIGKMGISSAFSVLCNYATELFPTVVRTAGFGFSSLFGRFGSIAAPQIHLLGVYSAPWVPLVFYGSFAFIAGFLNFFLPETMNKLMPQTMEDGLMLADKNYRKKKMKIEMQEYERQTSKF